MLYTYFVVFFCVSKVSSLTNGKTYCGGNLCTVKRITFSSLLANTFLSILKIENKINIKELVADNVIIL